MMMKSRYKNFENISKNFLWKFLKKVLNFFHFFFFQDKDRNKLKNIQAPGLGFDPRTPRTMKTYNESENESKNKFTTSDYVVPPKVPQLQMGPGIGPKR